MGEPAPKTLVKLTLKAAGSVGKNVTVAVLLVPYVTLAVCQKSWGMSLLMEAVLEEFVGPGWLPLFLVNHNSIGMPFGKVLGTGSP